MKIPDSGETKSMHGQRDLCHGAEMRMHTGIRSEQHLPAWLLGRRAEAQGGKGAGKEPEETSTDCLKELC